MVRVTCILVLLLCTLQDVYSWTETLSIEDGDCDSYDIRHVNNDHDYTVMWDGGDIPSYCKFPFIGRDDGYMNEYKVCVEATEFDLNDCGVKMKIEKGLSDHITNTYTCNDVVYKTCGNSDEYLTIEFDTVYTNQKPNGGDIELKITAEMTYNSTLVIGLSVGGAILGVILMSFFIVGVIRVSQRRRNQRGTVIHTTSAYPAQQTFVYQQEGVANPVMYPSVATNTSAPPPSYQSVVASSGNMTSPIAGK